MKTCEPIFQDWLLEVKKDIKRKGSFWHPTLVSGEQNARTVILRSVEFIKKGAISKPRFIVHTDTRSHKWQELKNNTKATLHFYCPKRRWQMRVQVSAELSLLDTDATIEWKRLSKNSQRIYSLKNSPGTIIQDPKAAYTFPEEIDGFDNFGVLNLIPIHMESLQLERVNGPSFHQRALWDLNTHTFQYLAP